MSMKEQPMDNKSVFDELVRETQRRQRRKTDLSAYEDKIREMLDLNISLPVVLEWLSKQGNVTTLPALRRYVVRVFGEDVYHDFMKRNGWLKTKSKYKLPNPPNGDDSSSANAGSKEPDGAAQAGTTSTSGGEASQTPLPKTGFHSVVEAIAAQNSGSDPRRND